MTAADVRSKQDVQAKRALVTGGAGFIGSRLARALLRAGRDVTIIDDLSMGTRDNLPPGARFVEGDIRDQAALGPALEGVEDVFHLAARVSVRASLDKFLDDAEVNVFGTLNLLRAMEGRGLRRLVLASSMAVYADSASPAPVAESHPTVPLSPYGAGKLAAEHYAMLVAPQFAVEPVTLRFFNVFGPGQAFTPYVGVVTIFARKLLAGEVPAIFGDGGQVRDFVAIEDIVEACMLAMDTPAAAGRIFNIGSGRGLSVNRIAELLRDRIAPDARISRETAHRTELRNSVADITLARSVLGYEPRHRFEDHIDAIVAAIATSIDREKIAVA